MDTMPSPNDVSAPKSPAIVFFSSYYIPPRLPDDEGEVICEYTLGPVVQSHDLYTIRRAMSPTGEEAAVKVIRHSDLSGQDNPAHERRRIERETTVWSNLKHEYILPLFSVVRTPYAYFFITEYCPVGSLFDFLTRYGESALPRDEARRILRHVAGGLKYLHEVAGLVHGDLRLENVFVDQAGACRIGDFSMSQRIGELDSDKGQNPHVGKHAHALSQQGGRSVPAAPMTRQTNNPIFLHYAAPELLFVPSIVPVTPHPAQDIWALGVLFYVLLTGRFPFADAFCPRLTVKIVKCTHAYFCATYLGHANKRSFYFRLICRSQRHLLGS